MPINFKAIEKYVRQCLATIIALGFISISVAQVKFSTVVNDRQPGLNDYIEVEYNVENGKSIEKLEPPSFKDFRLIQGPMQSNGMSYINGVMSQYKSVSFVLQPLVKGKITIPGAIAVVDGKTMRSEAVTINVRNEGANKSNSSPFPGISLLPDEAPAVDEEFVLKPGENIADKIRKNLFVKTDVNKTTCYQGEPIMATFKLCSRLKSESRVLKRPSLNGFSVYDMIEPESNRPTVQTINGRPFNVHIIRQTQLIPLQSGTFTIDPVELDNKVRFLKRSAKERAPQTRMQQLLQEYMDEGSRGEIVEQSFSLASKPVTITVKPLPLANKPSNFNGAVGKFTIKATCKNNTVAAGDEISVQLVINGAGNLTVINAPSIVLPEGIEGFEPVTKEKIDKTIYPLSGSKTFDYTFVAKDAGDYKIPAITFSYFDPSEASYKIERSDSFNIRVTPSVKRKASTGSGKIAGPESSGTNWMEKVSINTLVWVAAMFLVVGLLVYQWKKTRKKPVKKRSKVVETPIIEPPEQTLVQTNPLEQAMWQLKQGESEAFYKEINQAVWKIVSEKINIPSSELNKFNVVTQLQNRGAESAMISRLQDLLNECEIALYTPVHTAIDMEQSLAKAETVIKELQASIA